MFDDRIQKVAVTEADWIRGSQTAPVTLLEYGDFECPYCAAVAPTLKGLLNEFPDALRVVFRQFPVTSLHEHALGAAEAAEAAGDQGEFWEMHDLLFEHNDTLEYPYLLAYAESLGLDEVRFETELAERTHLDAVRDDFRRGIRDGVNGTPTLFINGRRYDGPRDRYSLSRTIVAFLPYEDRDHDGAHL